MEDIILRFISELRKSGIRVSPSESLDAVQAVALCGMQRRRLTRQLLRLTLVKNVGDIPVFNEIFNLFFTRLPAASNPDLPAIMDAVINEMQGQTTCMDQCDSRPQTRPLSNLGSEDPPPEDLDDLESLHEIDPEDTDGTETLVQVKGYRGKAQSPRPTRRQEQDPVVLQLDQEVAPHADAFTAREQIEMQEVVSRMMQRLRKDKRRTKNNQRRGKLHASRTIQKNYRHDMVPFELALRRRRREKPRLVVLCDVSYSVSYASRFMMLLLHTLQSQHLEVRSFIFNREIEEITEMIGDLPANDLMQAIDAGGIIDLDANSSFGQVFLSFRDRFLEGLRGGPAVIILGDARNNYGEANDWVLEEIREKARYLLWLTPLERELWARGDCLIELYGAYCDRVEVVGTVDDLSRMVEELLQESASPRAHPLDRQRIREVQAADDYDSRDYYTHRRKTGG